MTGGAVRPRPVEAIHAIPVGLLFTPLKRQGASSCVPHQALQLVPTMRRNLRVGMQGKAVHAGTAGSCACRTFAFIAKA